MSNTTKHTPGPWQYTPGYKPCVQLSDGRVMQFNHGEEANARLIAAAPELLEALKEAQCELEAIEKNSGILIVLDQIDAAIKKAEGN